MGMEKPFPLHENSRNNGLPFPSMTSMSRIPGCLRVYGEQASRQTGAESVQSH